MGLGQTGTQTARLDKPGVKAQTYSSDLRMILFVSGLWAGALPRPSRTCQRGDCLAVYRAFASEEGGGAKDERETERGKKKKKKKIMYLRVKWKDQ